MRYQNRAYWSISDASISGHWVLGPIYGYQHPGDLSFIFGGYWNIPQEIRKNKVGRPFQRGDRLVWNDQGQVTARWARITKMNVNGGHRETWELPPEQAVELLHNNNIGLPQLTWCIEKTGNNAPRFMIVPR
jgi:hypothetical protein